MQKVANVIVRVNDHDNYFILQMGAHGRPLEADWSFRSSVSLGFLLLMLVSAAATEAIGIHAIFGAFPCRRDHPAPQRRRPTTDRTTERGGHDGAAPGLLCFRRSANTPSTFSLKLGSLAHGVGIVLMALAATATHLPALYPPTKRAMPTEVAELLSSTPQRSPKASHPLTAESSGSPPDEV